MKRVWLDAGHGGADTGATATDGTFEKDCNLQLTLAVEDALLTAPTAIEIQMTRRADAHVPLAMICQTINENHKQESFDLIISIHHNAASLADDPARIHGFEVYYADSSPLASTAADVMLDTIRTARLYTRVSAISTETLGRRLAFIHDTIPPAILVECGYLSNQGDLTNIKDPTWRGKLAQALASGIRSYLKA